MLSINSLSQNEERRLLVWPKRSKKKTLPAMTGRQLKRSVPINTRALQRSTAQHQDNAPLPEPADQPLPADYVANVNNAIVSYNSTAGSSGRSSPTNVETQSTLSVSQGGWTTGNTTERSSLDSSYSLDDFDRQAASTVSQRFEEFESMLFEGSQETRSNVYRECQEWATQFPHLRVLGTQVMAPGDSGFQFTPTSSRSEESTTRRSGDSTPRPSTSTPGDLTASHNDLSLSSDIQGLTLSGRQVKASSAPSLSSVILSPGRSLDSVDRSSAYDFLHEEVLAEDGVYEDIIAVDYKNSYEDNLEYKRQMAPHRRRVGYPPITPNACVKDSVSSGAFDAMWCELMSWLRLLLTRYCQELEGKKESGSELALVQQPSFLRTSSFVLPVRSNNPMDSSFEGVLNVSRMSLRNRNTLGFTGAEVSDSGMLSMTQPALGPVLQRTMNRPATVNHPRWRQGQSRRLEPLPEPSKEEGRNGQPSPQNALRVRQIMPTGPHRLSSPPNPQGARLPPLDSSASLPSANRKLGYRASSAIDNKEGRSLGARERSSNAIEVSRPNTTQAFRSETPGYMNRRSSTPLGQATTSRQLYLMSGQPVGALGIMGSGLHPNSSDPVPHILEDPESPSVEDVRHNQWMPSTPSYTNNFYKRMRTLRN